jgi:hypothetical protein
MLQSMIVMLYGCGRFGYQTAGVVGAAIPVLAFGVIEVYLVRVTRFSPPG